MNNSELQWQETYNIGNNESPNSLCILDENYFYIGGIVYGDNSLAFLSKFEFNNTSVEESLVKFENYNLRNHPNPLNPSTIISFQLSDVIDLQAIEIAIYNLKGQKVKKLFPSLCHTELVEAHGKRQYSITWNGDDNIGNPVSSGIYLYELNLNGKTETVKKCLLLK